MCILILKFWIEIIDLVELHWSPTLLLGTETGLNKNGSFDKNFV